MRWEIKFHKYHLLHLSPTGAYHTVLPSTLLESAQWQQDALYTGTQLLQTGRTHSSSTSSGRLSQPAGEGPRLA